VAGEDRRIARIYLVANPQKSARLDGSPHSRDREIALARQTSRFSPLACHLAQDSKGRCPRSTRVVDVGAQLGHQRCGAPAVQIAGALTMTAMERTTHSRLLSVDDREASLAGTSIVLAPWHHRRRVRDEAFGHDGREHRGASPWLTRDQRRRARAARACPVGWCTSFQETCARRWSPTPRRSMPGTTSLLSPATSSSAGSRTPSAR
jgi:hypothetical protein